MGHATCSSEDCSSPVYARTLCSRCYQRARYRQAVPSSAAVNAPCAHCGEPMADRKSTRAKFCSPGCKEAARTATRQAGLVEARQGRTCQNCSGQISPERGSKSIYCSVACSVQSNNRKSAAARKVVRLTGRAPCRQCGGQIPTTTRSNAVFCSRQCKSLYRVNTHDAARARDLNLRGKYGLGAAEIDTLLAAQDGKCAICGTSEFPGKHNRPHVDHCHEGGGVRGILCHFCNLGLGNFRDQPELLEAAAAYIRQHR